MSIKKLVRGASPRRLANAARRAPAAAARASRHSVARILDAAWRSRPTISGRGRRSALTTTAGPTEAARRSQPPAPSTAHQSGLNKRGRR